VIQLIGAQARLLLRTVQRTRLLGLEKPELKRELRDNLVQAGILVSFGMAFFGSVMATIAWTQARKYTGNVAFVGPAYLELIVREFAPLLTALLVAARQAAANSAELGAMKVNEQVDALILCAGDPYAFLVAPRVLASVISLPLLTMLGTITSVAAAIATINAYGANGWSFAETQLIDGVDLFAALLKSLLCGLFIPLAACLRGLNAGPDAASVGQAVSAGMVEACLGCIAIDFLVTMSFLVASP
jgi:phospholipid/cholesterol/gamma-HCH transport system permease protein